MNMCMDQQQKATRDGAVGHKVHLSAVNTYIDMYIIYNIHIPLEDKQNKNGVITGLPLEVTFPPYQDYDPDVMTRFIPLII